MMGRCLMGTTWTISRRAAATVLSAAAFSACTTARHISCTGLALMKVCCGWQVMYDVVDSLFKGD